MNYLIAILTSLFVLAGNPKRRLYFEGQCLQVKDGDSMVLEVLGQKLNTRLIHIDAPELFQTSKNGKPIGLISKKYLEKYCHKLKVEIRGRGYYGRYLVILFHKNTSLNLELVQSGMAFVYPRSQFQDKKESELFKRTQKEAKDNLLGVWSDKVLRPWTYRKKQKKYLPQKIRKRLSY